MQQSNWQKIDLGDGAIVTNLNDSLHTGSSLQELEYLKAEVKTWKTRYLHLHGEMEKIRKRLERYTRRRIQREREKMLLDFLPLADDLERMVARRAALGENALHGEGLDLTIYDMQDVLARYGVKKVESLNQLYDPKFHEARGVAYNLGVEPGRVIQVIQNGYMCKSHVLRPAEVLVSA